ncbi:MAG TPA: Ig-like domain-containing protein [Acidimicrobiales bacterium]|jgi:hypothetical protein
MARWPGVSRWRVRFALIAVMTVLLGAGWVVSAQASTPNTNALVTVSPTSVTYGATVIYTIQVTSSSGTPQGQGFFQDGNTILCSFGLDTYGVGSCSASNASAGVDVITGIFVANTEWGSSSNTADLTVNVTPPAAPSGVSSSQSGAGTDQTGDVVVNDGNFYGQGNGPGAITVSNYSANPSQVSPTGEILQYGDVSVGQGSNFASLFVIACDVGAGSSLEFFDGTSWQYFSDQTLQPDDCVFAAVDASTVPTIAQLTGTPIALSLLAAPGTTQGYWLGASDGGIFSFNRTFYGSTGSIKLNQPVVGMAATHDDGGYWLAARDGGVFTFGDAGWFGSLPAEDIHVDNVVAIVNDPATGGYYLIGSNGTVWTFHAPSFGDLPTLGYNVNNIVGGALTPDDQGMYLVSSTGVVFNLQGDGSLQGDMSGVHLNAPMISMTVNPATGGYWLLGGDGGVFSFNAPFYGSTGNIRLNKPVVGMTATGDGGGYWFVAADGGVFSFGDATFYGSTGSIKLNKPVVNMAGS